MSVCVATGAVGCLGALVSVERLVLDPVQLQKMGYIGRDPSSCNRSQIPVPTAAGPPYPPYRHVNALNVHIQAVVGLDGTPGLVMRSDAPAGAAPYSYEGTYLAASDEAILPRSDFDRYPAVANDVTAPGSDFGRCPAVANDVTAPRSDFGAYDSANQYELQDARPYEELPTHGHGQESAGVPPEGSNHHVPDPFAIYPSPPKAAERDLLAYPPPSEDRFAAVKEERQLEYGVASGSVPGRSQDLPHGREAAARGDDFFADQAPSGAKVEAKFGPGVAGPSNSAALKSKPEPGLVPHAFDPVADELPDVVDFDSRPTRATLEHQTPAATPLQGAESAGGRKRSRAWDEYAEGGHGSPGASGEQGPLHEGSRSHLDPRRDLDERLVQLSPDTGHGERRYEHDGRRYHDTVERDAGLRQTSDHWENRYDDPRASYARGAPPWMESRADGRDAPAYPRRPSPVQDERYDRPSVRDYERDRDFADRRRPRSDNFGDASRRDMNFRTDHCDAPPRYPSDNRRSHGGGFRDWSHQYHNCDGVRPFRDDIRGRDYHSRDPPRRERDRDEYRRDRDLWCGRDGRSHGDWRERDHRSAREGRSNDDPRARNVRPRHNNAWDDERHLDVNIRRRDDRARSTMRTTPGVNDRDFPGNEVRGDLPPYRPESHQPPRHFTYLHCPEERREEVNRDSVERNVGHVGDGLRQPSDTLHETTHGLYRASDASEGMAERDAVPPCVPEVNAGTAVPAGEHLYDSSDDSDDDDEKNGFIPEGGSGGLTEEQKARVPAEYHAHKDRILLIQLEVRKLSNGQDLRMDLLHPFVLRSNIGELLFELCF